MRCDDVIRELAVPTDDRDTAALASHLANCGNCADWAQKDSQFERLWDATRPVEPSAQLWDEVWSHVAASLDSPMPVELKIPTAASAALNGSVILPENAIQIDQTASVSLLEMGGNRSGWFGPGRCHPACRETRVVDINQVA